MAQSEDTRLSGSNRPCLPNICTGSEPACDIYGSILSVLHAGRTIRPCRCGPLEEQIRGFGYNLQNWVLILIDRHELKDRRAAHF